MIDRDETYTDEILLHRPPEKPKKPKKSKHKHIYEPCVLGSTLPRYDKRYGFVDDAQLSIGEATALSAEKSDRISFMTMKDGTKRFRNPQDLSDATAKNRPRKHSENSTLRRGHCHFSN